MGKRLKGRNYSICADPCGDELCKSRGPRVSGIMRGPFVDQGSGPSREARYPAYRTAQMKVVKPPDNEQA